MVTPEYEINGTDEAFTIDDLGNRDMVNVRSGPDANYVIDANSNRYISVGGNSLSYDNAGNLTQDRNGYDYQYDYENRIVKITEGETDIAEFEYDALGRRIRKVDSVADETTMCYHNNDWQVLSEVNESDVQQRWFV